MNPFGNASAADPERRVLDVRPKTRSSRSDAGAERRRRSSPAGLCWAAGGRHAGGGLVALPPEAVAVPNNSGGSNNGGGSDNATGSLLNGWGGPIKRLSSL